MLKTSRTTPYTSLPVAQAPGEVIYPESDGKPMAETDTHRDQMADALIYPLKEWLRGQNVYISGNLNLYYEKGKPKAVVAPDVFVVFGVPNHTRRTYRLWDEGKAPDVVFEITSTSTRQEDLRDKRYLYEGLGVKEYFLFDPLREYLKPPLQGFRLAGEYYEPLTPQAGEGEWYLFSETLGLELHTRGNSLRLFDPQTSQYLRTYAEEAEALRNAEAEISRLRRLLEEQGKF
jgi:Uma2 family endonuclease